MELLQKVQNVMEEHGLLCRGDGVIVGCSGGPDSLCLLHLLLRLREPMELTLRVVHIEHGIRGQASAADARFVEQFCQQQAVECVTFYENVKEQAQSQGLSEETAGRRARYCCFFQEQEALGRQMGVERCRVKIAVAHNRNDQAETVLMRIMRGTGVEGLRGMELSREDGVIRPLLTTDRREIEAYCAQMGLQPRCDHTNLQAEYTRNRVRLELIPYMRQHFNDNVEEALCRLGRIAAEEHQVVLEEAERLKDQVACHRRELRALPHGLRHQVMRLALKDRGLRADVAAVHLEQLDRLLDSQSASGEICLPGGYGMAVSYDRVIWRAPGSDASRPLGTVSMKEISREELEGLGDWKKPSSLCCCFDGDKMAEGLTSPPVLRTREAGDVIRPLGAPGRKKLQDWFVDHKIPRQERDRIPLLCSGHEVLWIVGYQSSENYKVEEGSKRLIFVEFHQ